jgi:hypothetical protein
MTRTQIRAASINGLMLAAFLPAVALAQDSAAAGGAAAAVVPAPRSLTQFPAVDFRRLQDPAAPAPQTPVPSSKVFNPDISVVANFLGVAGRNPINTGPALQLTEAEVAFQAVVDPYARADFFVAAGPEGVELEEGFITFTALPAHLLLKAGKMRAQFGKVNTLHTHLLPTADRPLVTTNLVGGEEGLSDSGLSLSYLLQNPILFLDIMGEVYGGQSEVFQSPTRSKLAYVGRVRGYRDLTESMNIDVGGSFAFGPAEVEGLPLEEPTPEQVSPLFLDKRLIAFDATFRYRPLARAIYRRLNLRTEMIWSRQDLATGSRAQAFGIYGLGEYQFSRRWYIGGRLDRSERLLDDTLRDSGASVFLTFWPTEFNVLRAQLRRTRFAEGVTANEFLFQFSFSIGAHGAHVF